jgi:hypothetical protein
VEFYLDILYPLNDLTHLGERQLPILVDETMLQGKVAKWK